MGLGKRIEQFRWDLWYYDQRLRDKLKYRRDFESRNKSVFGKSEKLGDTEYLTNGQRIHGKRRRVFRIHFTPNKRTLPAQNMQERIDSVSQGVDGFLDLIQYLKLRPWKKIIVGDTNETMANFAVKYVGFKHATRLVEGEPDIFYKTGSIVITRGDIIRKKRELRELQLRTRRHRKRKKKL